MKVRKRRERRRWVHLSAVNHGLVFDARRVSPLHGNGEPSTPRVCVAANVSRCLAARLFSPRQRVWVYLTESECRAVVPPGGCVWDELVTRERWIIPPVRFFRVGEVPGDVIGRVYRAVAGEITTRMASNHRISLRALYEAVEGLEAYPGAVGAPRWHGRDKRLLRLCGGAGCIHGLGAA